jgi:hypothetical protein
MEELDEEFILKVSQKFFPFLTSQNFSELFKINIMLFKHIAIDIMDSFSRYDLVVRNLLLFLFSLKHYLPFRASCIIFGLKKTQYSDIFYQMLQIFNKKYKHYVDIDNRLLGNELCSREFPNTYIVVDSTECNIESNNNEEFSGKKGYHTLKYQLIVGAVTGEILGIHGPEPGPTADAKIYELSGLGQYLEDNGEHCLADKGYVGCRHAIHPLKKKRSAITLAIIPFTQEQMSRNKRISHFRIRIENTNSYIKDWSILSHEYRGSAETHTIVFTSCCYLFNMSNQYMSSNDS